MATVNVSTVACRGEGRIDVRCDRSNNYSYVGTCTCGWRLTGADREDVKAELNAHLMAYMVGVKCGLIREGLAIWRS